MVRGSAIEGWVWWRGSRGGVYRVIAQKGGPVLGSVSGVDRTLRGHLDRDGSGVGCLGKGLGTVLLDWGFHSLWGGHTVGFLSICLPVFWMFTTWTCT